MTRKRKVKGWAGIPLIVAVAGLAALLLANFVRPDLISPVLAATSALLGITFLWVFGRRDVWWAVIPGVGLMGLALVCLVRCVVLGGIVWLEILILGLTAYVIAVIPNRKVWVNIFYVLGLILVLDAIYISPIVQWWKVGLMVAFVLLLLLTLWLDREDLSRLWD